MLFTRSILEGVRSGEITLAFRRWKRPTVRTGGTLRTSIGVLAIDRVERIEIRDITEADARKAGHASRSSLLSELEKRGGELFRIEIRLQGDDPRLTLRESTELTDAELGDLEKKLERLDARSRQGAWTFEIFRAISRHPHVAAGELADLTGFEKEWLKTQIRKLKNLGLTISHQPGYELYPRGRVVLEWLEARKTGA